MQGELTKGGQRWDTTWDAFETPYLVIFTAHPRVAQVELYREYISTRWGEARWDTHLDLPRRIIRSPALVQDSKEQQAGA